ncbi:nucleolar protein 16, partial [Saccharata proteae CBS 121410]
MGRELQKKKNRSGLSKVRKNPKSKKKILNNPIIAANWNQNETLTQNYRRLGLTTKLNSTTGGVERTAKSLPQDGSEAPSAAQAAQAPLAIKSKLPTFVEPGEATIVRDPETGEIRVIEEGAAKKPNPLNDPLNDIEDDSEDIRQGATQHDLAQETTGAVKQSANPVIQQLEAHAASGVRKAPRKQSEREQEWIERLVAKYGDDYARMSRDMKLNPMQQSEGDIKRRVRRWRESR